MHRQKNKPLHNRRVLPCIGRIGKSIIIIALTPQIAHDFPMTTPFLDLGNAQKIAFTYEANGYIPEPKKEPIKKMDDGRYVHRLEDIIEDHKPTRKPLVILVHDFPETPHTQNQHALFDTYAARLKEDGFPTMRFDFRGCGDSTGESVDFTLDSAAEDLTAIMEWAKKTHGHGRFAMIAAGLNACTVARTYDPHTLCALSLLWPVFQPMESPIAVIDTAESRKMMKENGYCLLDDHKIGSFLVNELRTLDLIPSLQKIRTATQIQQGADDEYATHETIEKIKKNLTGLKDFAGFEDGKHYLPDPVMRRQVIDNTLYFLNKHAYRLPPGHDRRIDKAAIFRHRG